VYNVELWDERYVGKDLEGSGSALIGFNHEICLEGLDKVTKTPVTLERYRYVNLFSSTLGKVHV
jgi:hypothetical protein